MRIRILRENEPTTDNRLIDVEWPIIGAIPVYLAYGGRFIGYLTDFAREAGGWLTGELALVAEVQVAGLAVEPDFEAYHVTGNAEGQIRLRGARLRAVHLGEHPVWPGMEIV